MLRKIYEVLFRNERMCATRFSTSGVAFLRMTVMSMSHSRKKNNDRRITRGETR